MRLKDITCISDLYYVMGRWFTLFMVILAFATLPFALEASDTIWSFAMCAGVAFVGVASNYRDKGERYVHFGAAVISALCCLVFASIHPWSYLCLNVACVSIIDTKRWLLWHEVACFLTSYTAIVLANCEL